MCNKKGIKKLFMVGAAALMLVGAVFASPKILSKACIANYLGPFNSRIVVTTPTCEYICLCQRFVDTNNGQQRTTTDVKLEFS